MIYSSSRNSEFGPVPEEDAVVREKDLTPAEDGLGLKKEAGPAPEDTSPAPEMIEPGTFPWSSGKKDGKKLLARQGVFLAAAALTLLFTVGWFDAE